MAGLYPRTFCYIIIMLSHLRFFHKDLAGLLVRDQTPRGSLQVEEKNLNHESTKIGKHEKSPFWFSFVLFHFRVFVMGVVFFDSVLLWLGRFCRSVSCVIG